MAKHLIVSDIDGTLLPPQNPYGRIGMIKAFNRQIRQPGLILAYATGRHLELALRGLKQSGLRRPDYFICDVGTSIYIRKNKRWRRDRGYDELMQYGWQVARSEDIAKYLKEIKEVRPQPKNSQKQFKRSYLMPLEYDARKILVRIENKLKHHGVQANIIYSVDHKKSSGLVDILPKNASKLTAIDYLRKNLKLSQDKVIYAGDSGNDGQVMLSGIKSILVSNATETFKNHLNHSGRKEPKPVIYKSTLNYASGVLEGLRHYRTLKKSRNSRLYIQMHSLHGLFRSSNLELGRDEDTGGQIVYVLELARALSRDKRVGRVDILTRRIQDDAYPGYSAYLEPVNKKVNVVRIDCGPPRYIMKVDLWPFLDEYVENAIDYTSRLGRIPDILHTNYADAGLAGARLSEMLNVPQVHTGHSLGRNKMERMGVSVKNRARFEKRFHFKERLAAEAEANRNARTIFVSSAYERREQYRPYRIDARSPKFQVVPPGTDYSRLWPYNKGSRSEKNRETEIKIKKRLGRLGVKGEKPIILCISRLDHRKNLISLVRAFCLNPELKDGADLVLALGPLTGLAADRQNLLNEINREIKANNAQNKVKFIEDLNQDEAAGLYRTAARSGGVFVNPALIEPFGLTLLEAGACGLPVAATRVGGPVDIIDNCRHGILFDPEKPESIASAIARVIFRPKKWREYSRNGIELTRQNYTWQQAAKKELEVMFRLLGG